MTAVAVESKIERIGITDAFGLRCLVPKYGSHADGQKTFVRQDTLRTTGALSAL